MPPKRRRAEQTPDEPVATASTAASGSQKAPAVSQEDPDTAPPAAKRAKTSEQIVDDEAPPSLPASSASGAASHINEDEADDGRPVCRYDENCYRRNAQHFQEFRHPKRRAKEIGASSGSATPAAAAAPKPTLHKRNSLTRAMSTEEITSAVRPQIELYKSVLRTVLAESTIDTTTKKMLRKLRQDNKISEAEHDQCLGQFGWTPDEFEDGEKKADDFLLDEEKEIYKNPEGFKIITIAAKKKRSKQEDLIWASAVTPFYQTMSKAQSNYAITSIGVVANTKLRKNYLDKRAALLKKDASLHQEEWGFHGTSEFSIGKIVETGFKHPDDLAKEKAAAAATTNKGKKKKPAKQPPSVELLDDGYFGKGIYFSMYSDYAMWYSEERGSNQILLSKLLTGKVFKCTQRMDGQDKQPGYDAHYSPKGNEVIVFESAQVLPRFIITFEEKEAEEREQED